MKWDKRKEMLNVVFDFCYKLYSFSKMIVPYSVKSIVMQILSKLSSTKILVKEFKLKPNINAYS